MAQMGRSRHHPHQPLMSPNEGQGIRPPGLCNRYQINCNFLQALTVRHSIPHSWRQMLTAGFSRPISPKFTFEINGTRFGILNSSPKGWYRKLVGKCASPFSRGSSWRTELDVQTEPEWEKYGHYHTQFPGKLNCNLLPI